MHIPSTAIKQAYSLDFTGLVMQSIMLLALLSLVLLSMLLLRDRENSIALRVNMLTQERRGVCPSRKTLGFEQEASTRASVGVSPSVSARVLSSASTRASPSTSALVSPSVLARVSASKKSRGLFRSFSAKKTTTTPVVWRFEVDCRHGSFMGFGAPFNLPGIIRMA